jgi:peptidoglycan hydrolase CwlO-like protein
VNLIAKSLLREFDVTKKNADAALNNVEEDDEDIVRELADLSADVERGENDIRDEEDLEDNEEGWVNEVALLPEDEKIELQRNIRPVKLVLLKVR